MIKSLQEALQGELDAAFYKRNREYMDSNLDTTMTIKAKTIQTHLINDLIKIIDNMNSNAEKLKLQENSPAPKRFKHGKNKGQVKMSTAAGAQANKGQPDLMGNINPGTAQVTQVGRTSIPIDKKLMKIAVKFAYAKHFTPTKYKTLFKKILARSTNAKNTRNTPSAKFLADFNRFLFIFKGSTIQIKFGGAEIGQGGGKQVGDLALLAEGHQRVVDATNLQLMRDAFSTFRKKYLKLLKKNKFDTIENEFGSLADATGVGTGYIDKKAPAKTHGETTTGILNRGQAVPAKDPQTGTVATVAITGLARETDRIFKDMKTSYKPAGDNFSNSEMDIVLEETRNLLERNYKLKHIRDGKQKEDAIIGKK